MDINDNLDRHFPGHRSDSHAPLWEEAKQRFSVGSSVTGVVVFRAPFGAFVDIGAGFPALLELPEIAGLTPEMYQANDWCPVGGELTARVMVFRDRNRQICVSQVRLMPGPKPA